MALYKTQSALSTALRVIGVLNVIGGIIAGINLSKEVLKGRYWSETIYHPDILIGCIFLGIVGCVFCFALAKCVLAAAAYLSMVAPEKA